MMDIPKDTVVLTYRPFGLGQLIAILEQNNVIFIVNPPTRQIAMARGAAEKIFGKENVP